MPLVTIVAPLRGTRSFHLDLTARTICSTWLPREWSLHWVSTLVRNILLAEPMVDALGRCFADVTREETAGELADSFRLENYVVRERLAAVLSASARQPS